MFKPILLVLQESYNTGDYINAVFNRQKAETISSVLYPDDRSYQVHIFFFLLKSVRYTIVDTWHI